MRKSWRTSQALWQALGRVAGVCGTPQPRSSTLVPGLRSTADPGHPCLDAIRIVSILVALASTASAKGPTVDHLFPAGGSRGSTVEVVATGQFERWPVQVWTSSPGLMITQRPEKGKLTVAIAADLTPGVHWIRLFDDEGATAPRPFLVGTLPEANEVEPNDEISKAQAVDASGVTINGQLGKSGDVDAFRVTLKKGQTLVASMEANQTLGSPMDGVLQVASAQGFVLAQIDDEIGRDPRIIFEAPFDGDYLVRAFAFPFVQESTIRFAGNPSYVYRLTLTTRGFADHPHPLVVTRGTTGEVEPIGWNILEGARKLIVAKSDEDQSILSDPLLANLVEVRRVDVASIVEVEPNDRAHPQAIVWPMAISGRIDRPGDVDVFEFAARKGEILAIQLDSRELGFPLDAVLRIFDSSGSTIAEVDDAKKEADPEIRFTPPADGTYRVMVRDLNGHGGPDFAYLLTVEAPRPDFRLMLKPDPIVVTPGKPFDLAIVVDRSEGFAEPVEIRLADHFDGLIAEPVVSTKMASNVTLKLKACDCVRPGPIRVVGVSRNGKTKRAMVSVAGSNLAIDSAWLTPARPVETKPKVDSKEPDSNK